MKYKVDDWGFFEFELVYIKEVVYDNRITEVNTGSFNTSGHDLSDRWFPINKTIRSISDTYKYYYDELHKYDFNGLNWPDIHRWFVAHWVYTCVSSDKAVDNFYKERYKSLEEFVHKFRDICSGMKGQSIEGVKLLRQ